MFVFAGATTQEEGTKKCQHGQYECPVCKSTHSSRHFKRHVLTHKLSSEEVQNIVGSARARGDETQQCIYCKKLVSYFLFSIFFFKERSRQSRETEAQRQGWGQLTVDVFGGRCENVNIRLWYFKILKRTHILVLVLKICTPMCT